jgi:hypothetical protein
MKYIIYWVRDDDSVMSSSKDTTILVRLAPPVLFGDKAGTPFDTIWTVTNNGTGVFYNVHVNSRDTNGTIPRYYWSEEATFDSTSVNTTKTNDSLFSRRFSAGDLVVPVNMWIYGRDDDGLLRGGKFVVFADSAPPAPVVTFSISAGGGIINWRGKDTKDGNLTQYEILLKKGTTDPVEPTNIISQYNAGSNYSAATVGGFDFSYSFITQGSGEYHCQVIAKDARGTISKSTVVISAY